METEFKFQVENEIAELDKIAVMVRKFSRKNALPIRAGYLINLVLDEVITNVISYGYDDDGKHLIDVRMTLQGETLVIEVEDDGAPFSIMDAPKIDLEQSLEDRPIGGLGCHIVTQMMDEIFYQRRSGRNRLIMKKDIGNIGPFVCD